MPLLAALEAEDVPALALYGPGVDILNFHSVAAVGRRAPAQQAVALDKAIRYELLVLGADARLSQQVHDRHVVHQNITAVSGAGNGLAQSLLHDLCREVLDPAGLAEAVAALEPGHIRVLVLEEANVAVFHHRDAEHLQGGDTN